MRSAIRFSKMKKIFRKDFILNLLFIYEIFAFSSCDPNQTVIFKIDNQTDYDAEMQLFSEGSISQDFQIEKQDGTVIFSDTGLSPSAFQTGDYDSIKFLFDNSVMLKFIKDAAATENDIYDGNSWIVENEKHSQTFTYRLTDEMLE